MWSSLLFRMTVKHSATWIQNCSKYVAVIWRAAITFTLYSTASFISRFFWRVGEIAKGDYLIRHVCPSVRPCGATRLQLNGFPWNFAFRVLFVKSVKKIQVPLRSEKNNGHLTWDQYPFLIISRSVLLRMRNVSYKSCTENQNTHFVFSNLLSKIVSLWDNVEKYCRAGQATDNNMAHAHCVLDTEDYKHTLRKCNTHCFSAETINARTPLNIMLNVYCLSCI